MDHLALQVHYLALRVDAEARPRVVQPAPYQIPHDGSTGKLIFNGQTYNFDSTLSYVGGYTSANVTQGGGNVTGMDFNLVFSGSPIGRIHGELYALYPDNPQITDSGGILLPGIPLTEFVSNPWNVIDLGHFGSDGSYTWHVSSYSDVPEPSTFVAGVLLLGGCAGNLLRRSRQRKSQAAGVRLPLSP